MGMCAVQTMRIIVLGLLNFVLLHFLWSCFHLKRKEGCIEGRCAYALSVATINVLNRF